MMSESSPNCNQTHIHQLLDLLCYHRILSVSAECLRVLLHLFQDEPHGWVTHDLLHLRVSHGLSLHIFGAVVSVVLAIKQRWYTSAASLLLQSSSSAFW